MTKLILRTTSIFALLLGVFSASAQILQGTTTVNAGNNMVITVTVNTITDEVEIEATGPSTVWFGYGFGGTNMTNRYALITEGTGSISERKLGNHNSGSLLASSLTTSSSTTLGLVRTVTVTRPRLGSNANYFTFPETPGSITLIWAKGNGSSLSNHGSGNRGTAVITLSDICIGAIDTSVVTISNGLVANHVGTNATYQWIDCNTNIAVPGATSQTLMAPNSSDFRVVISDGACVDSSSCKSVVLFGIDERELLGVNVFPNPASEVVTVQLTSGHPHQITLTNAMGQQIINKNVEGLETILPIQNLAAGIYFIEVVQSEKVFRQKIIVE